MQNQVRSKGSVFELCELFNYLIIGLFNIYVSYTLFYIRTSNFGAEAERSYFFFFFFGGGGGFCFYFFFGVFLRCFLYIFFF